MSDIIGELARVRGAFATPTLTLLHKKTAPAIIAIFRSSFSRDVRSVPTSRLHDQVETYIEELKLAGETNLPGSGRDLCLRWMRDDWLTRDYDDDGTEVYLLTSHARDALSLVKDLTRERASLSEHRIATILAAVRRFNTEVNPDRAARVSILNSEIARLTAERDRIIDGGELPRVSEDYLLEGFTEVLGLIGDLPSDFARVEEAFVKLRSEILASFRAEHRTAGEVIDEYLTRADTLMGATPEGRAFEGAFALLRDDALLLQLREDISALLDHPQADDILLDGDRKDLRGTVALIRAGIDQVLAQRTRVTATLREYIVTHDITRDRQLDDTLRQLDHELATWMQTARPRATVDLQLLPRRAEVTHLRQRFYDPTNDATPPPLADISDHEPEPLSLTDLLTQGGPTVEALRVALADAIAASRSDGGRSLGEVFNNLPEDLRRPVEIFGLLHLAANLPAVEPQSDGHEVYQTRRPDGTHRHLAVPRFTTGPLATDSPTATEDHA